MEPGGTRIPTTGTRAEAPHLPGGTARGLLSFLHDEQTHFFLLIVVVGIGAGGVALAARWLTVAVTAATYHAWTTDLVVAVGRSPWYLRLLGPAAGAALTGVIVQRIGRRAGGGGVAGILEAVTLRHGFLSLRRSAWTAFASIVAIGSGSSVGREGAIVGTSSALGSRLGRAFGLTDARVRLLVAAGAGAGFAAAYNTPIAATLFVLEIVAGSFATDLIGPTVIASVVGTLVGRIYLWQGPIYEVPQFVLRSPAEILNYAGLGLLAGFVGVLFLAVLRLGAAGFERLAWPRWARTALGGLLVGLVALHLPHVCGNGYETVVGILNARIGFVTLLLLLGAKTIATSASIGAGSPGGVFTPTLFVGAALGGVTGNLLHDVFPLSTGSASSYALVGMGALLAATIRGPMTATVLVAELTGDYHVVLPQLLACALAATITRRMDSVYTRELRRRGISWEGTLEQRIVHSIRARDIMRTDVPVLRPETPFAEVVRLFTTTRNPCLYVVGADGRLTGVIELHAVKEFLAAEELSRVLIAQDLSEPARSVTSDASLAVVNEKLWFIDTGEVPVVDVGPGGRFLGIVTQRDLLGFLDREILRRNLLVAEVRWRDGLEKGVDYLELPEGYRLEVLEVPRQLVGRTLREAQLRSRHGLNVVAVENADEHGNERRRAPDPGYRLRARDRVVAVGMSEDLDAFAKLRA